MMRSGLGRLGARLRAFGSDESGQSALFAVCTMMLLATAIAYTYNFGLTVSERVRLQNAADTAAYSGAVIEANTLSSIAWLNSCQTHLHAQMQQIMLEVVRYSTAAALVEYGRFTKYASEATGRRYNRRTWRAHVDGVLPDYLFNLIRGQAKFEEYGAFEAIYPWGDDKGVQRSRLKDGQPPRDLLEGWMEWMGDPGSTAATTRIYSTDTEEDRRVLMDALRDIFKRLSDNPEGIDSMFDGFEQELRNSGRNLGDFTTDELFQELMKNHGGDSGLDPDIFGKFFDGSGDTEGWEDALRQVTSGSPYLEELLNGIIAAVGGDEVTKSSGGGYTYDSVMANTTTVAPNLGLHESVGGDLMDLTPGLTSPMTLRFGLEALGTLTADGNASGGIADAGMLADATKKLLLPEAERLIGQRFSDNKTGVRRGEMWIRQLSILAAGLAEAMPLLIRDEILYQVRLNAPPETLIAMFPEITVDKEKVSGAPRMPAEAPALAKNDREADDAFFRYEHYAWDSVANRFLTESRRQATRLGYDRNGLASLPKTSANTLMDDAPYFEFNPEKYYYFDEVAGKPYTKAPRRRYYFDPEPRTLNEENEYDKETAFSATIMCWNDMDRRWAVPEHDARWYEKIPLINYQLFLWLRDMKLPPGRANRDGDGRCTCGYVYGYRVAQRPYYAEPDRIERDDDAADGHWHSRHVHAHSLNCQPQYAPLCIGIVGPQCLWKSAIQTLAFMVSYMAKGELHIATYHCGQCLSHSAMMHNDGTAYGGEETVHVHCDAAISNWDGSIFNTVKDAVKEKIKGGGGTTPAAGGTTGGDDPASADEKPEKKDPEGAANSDRHLPDILPGLLGIGFKKAQLIHTPAICYLMTCQIQWVTIVYIPIPFCTCTSCLEIPTSNDDVEDHGLFGCNSLVAVLFEFLGPVHNPFCNWPMGFFRMKEDTRTFDPGTRSVDSPVGKFTQHMGPWLQFFPGHFWTTYDWQVLLAGDYYFYDAVKLATEAIHDIKGDEARPLKTDKGASAPIEDEPIDFIGMLGIDEMINGFINDGLGRLLGGGPMAKVAGKIFEPVVKAITAPLWEFVNELLNEILPDWFKELVNTIKGMYMRSGHHAILVCPLCARPCPVCNGPGGGIASDIVKAFNFKRNIMHSGRDDNGDRRADVGMHYGQVLNGHDWVPKEFSFDKEDSGFQKFTLGVDIDDGTLDNEGKNWKDNFACDRFVRQWTAPRNASGTPDMNFAPTVVATENVMRYGITVALYAPHRPRFFNKLFKGQNDGYLAVATARVGFAERPSDYIERSGPGGPPGIVTGADEPRDPASKEFRIWTLDSVWSEFLHHPPMFNCSTAQMTANATEGNLYYPHWGAKLTSTRYAVLGSERSKANATASSNTSQRRRVSEYEYTTEKDRSDGEEMFWKEFGKIYLLDTEGKQTGDRLRAKALGGSGDGDSAGWSRFVAAYVTGQHETRGLTVN